MKRRRFKYIYGPVPSWRLGRSLGIDPISGRKKVCSFDCVYCQIGPTSGFTKERKIYVPTEEIIKELIAFPRVEIDYLTFSGMGEPTLAKNLGELIRIIRKIRKEKIAVLTNSSLMDRKDVRQDLCLADFVIAKLDAADRDSLARINRPLPEINFQKIVAGIKQFRKECRTRLALQIMFIEQNRNETGRLVKLVREIEPDEVQINTPLRPCPVSPLSREEIEKIAAGFQAVRVVSVYQTEKKKVQPVSKKETLKRRGKI